MEFTEIAINAGIDIWQVVKWFYVLAFVVYFVFAIIVWRQIDLMVKTLNGSLYLPIKLLGIGLVLLSGGVMALALMVL